MALCGAKTRSGEPCKNHPAPGKKRCRRHGGASTGAPKGNSNNTRHGFYSDALQPEERKLWQRVVIGGIDDEIRLMRVKLHRLVRLSGSQDVADLIDAALEVARKQGNDPQLGPFDRSEIKVKAPQYGDLILQAVAEIRKLELQRLQMQLLEKQIKGDGDDESSHEVVGFESIPYDE
jgi:hypothetical protein